MQFRISIWSRLWRNAKIFIEEPPAKRMGLYDTSSVTTTTLDTDLTAISIDSQDTQYSVYTPEWQKWHGMYREVGRLQAIIDKVAVWSAGKGIKAKDKNKQKILDNLRGNGKDTSRDIAINQIRTSDICGDSFAEIIRNKRGELINLKPLSPGSIQIINDSKGMLVGYNLTILKAGADGKTQEIKIVPNAEGSAPTFAPDEIFALPRMRIADENHGIGVIERIEDIILKKKEAMNIMQKIVRRNAKPIVIIEADTDDTVKMASLKTKYKDLIEKDEAMIVPKDSIKLLDFASKLNIDFMPWLTYLDKEFLIAEGVPEVILGAISTKDTESASKIVFTAWGQVVKDKQNWFEEQWKAQIGFEIELPEPPNMEEMVGMDVRKAGAGNKITDVSATGENK
jgi:hypothetical protein